MIAATTSMVGTHLMAVRQTAELAAGMAILGWVFVVAEILVFLAELWW